jgi:nickel-dependent lactate racemase
VIVKVPRGTECRAVDLRGLRIRHLQPNAPRQRLDSVAIVADAIDRPLDTEPLSDLCRGRRRVTLVVPDGTRKACLPEILPVIFARLVDAGVQEQDVTVLVACGTHPPTPQAELVNLVGVLPSSVQLIQHECRDLDQLVEVGRLPGGQSVSLHRSAVEADLLVTIGAVRHHYFAGFGGGPKMIFPGVAGYAEIQANHSRVMDLRRDPPTRHARCEPGVLAGNPVAEEIAAAADLLPPDLAVALLPAPDGRIGAAFAGSWRPTVDAAVATCREWYEVDDGPFGLAVASAQGPPSDSTLIQAHKALDAVCRFLEPGAEVLFVAALDQGLGSKEMQPFISNPDPELILRRLNERWVQYGHTALRLLEKTHRFRIHLDSDLDPSVSAQLGFTPVEAPDDVVEEWRERFPGQVVAVMAGAPVFPRQS